MPDACGADVRAWDAGKMGQSGKRSSKKKHLYNEANRDLRACAPRRRPPSRAIACWFWS